ncbi:predicted protein [Naegleria gruberi]|uniref:Predicted protein n=1 Tax=Naegleria gruberi TaxID=5762 RepID=D2VIV6_NAEGR|nr:uncharacterized protein NAEGRDRAFT_68815 [Naegleria gruberi]EFC43168.1 predicted protein [Naegleria gruberi]|eukprot:XP_002675912.1 predicted protein [Naegleria gruberi strain NEG-M]
MIHQFSHQEPVVSFVTNTTSNTTTTTTTTSNTTTSNNSNINDNDEIIEYLNKLTLETMVSVQPIPSNVKNIQDVKETSLQLLEHSSIQIIDSYIHQLNNGHDCFTSTYTMNTSDPSFTFMVSSLLYNNMVYSISTYTISKSFNNNVELLFKQIHQSFNFIK